MERYEFFLASPLEKVFPDKRPDSLPLGAACSCWRGTRTAVQLIYRENVRTEGQAQEHFEIKVIGAPCAASLRAVELVPSDFPCSERRDAHYLTDMPGLFPDLLSPMKKPVIAPLPRQYRSVWITFDVPEEAAPGDYPISVQACSLAEEDQKTYECQLQLRVMRAQLQPQTLLHTEWFYADCLAQYYGVEPYSEAHWAILTRFIHAAGREHGVNVLLTPVFTPPLDTAVGHERLCVQLVDISLDAGVYHFGFEKLARWAGICKESGIEVLEIAHLFTQWGARATPNIYVRENGNLHRAFGWEVASTSPAYRKFLEAFLPALREALASFGYDDEHVIYHISDEPSADHAKSYRAARAQVVDLLKGCRIVDALSDIAFYQEGIVEHPVVANDHIEPFLRAGVPGLWVYYCCGQCVDVPNRFYAMPSARNRIMGVLMYLNDIRGFLHWGFNFYNAQYSLHPIDPYRVTHAMYAFPSGDAYLVYPGPGGEPLSSIRAEVQSDALYDLRALCQLEALAGRPFVEALIYELAGTERITFKSYPMQADFLLALRERVAAEIDARI